MEIEIKVKTPNKEFFVCTKGGKMKEALYSVTIALRNIKALQHHDKIHFSFDKKTNTILGEPVKGTLTELALYISHQNALLWDIPKITF